MNSIHSKTYTGKKHIVPKIKKNIISSWILKKLLFSPPLMNKILQMYIIDSNIQMSFNTLNIGFTFLYMLMEY